MQRYEIGHDEQDGRFYGRFRVPGCPSWLTVPATEPHLYETAVEAVAVAGHNLVRFLNRNGKQAGPKNPGTVIVEPHHENGEKRFAPVCERAQAFATIAGTRTLTWEAIAQIRALGFTVEERAPAPLFA